MATNTKAAKPEKKAAKLVELIILMVIRIFAKKNKSYCPKDLSDAKQNYPECFDCQDDEELSNDAVSKALQALSKTPKTVANEDAQVNA